MVKNKKALSFQWIICFLAIHFEPHSMFWFEGSWSVNCLCDVCTINFYWLPVQWFIGFTSVFFPPELWTVPFTIRRPSLFPTVVWLLSFWTSTVLSFRMFHWPVLLFLLLWYLQNSPWKVLQHLALLEKTDWKNSFLLERAHQQIDNLFSLYITNF